MKDPYNPKMLTKEFEKFLLENGYTHIRELEDGSVAAITKLIFTTAICIDLDYMSWASRYCFKNEEDAIEQLEKIKTADCVPRGYLARRGREPENNQQAAR